MGRCSEKINSTSVKQEILYQTGIISKEIYSNLYSVRKARNKLVHEGKMVSEEDATDLYNATNKLLQIATGQLGSEILPNALLLDRIHKTAFRRFGRQRRQQQTGGCYVGRWKFHCVDRAFRVPPFRFWTEKKQETFFRFPAWYAAV